MARVIRQNIHTAYSLHDMGITAFEREGERLVVRCSTGMVKVGHSARQVEGHLEFEDVQWDFSYVYLLDHVGNTGKFSGEKMFLLDFLDRYDNFVFTVMDESYGFNSTKYTGHLSAAELFCECMAEICHEGDMIFVDETDYSGMGEVILSHDGQALLCRVPGEVAGNLEQFCWDFATSWVWHGPENGRYLRRISEEQIGAVFGAQDFIDYLNRWVFEDQPSQVLAELGICFDQLPEEYDGLPRYNF